MKKKQWSRQFLECQAISWNGGAETYPTPSLYYYFIYALGFPCIYITSFDTFPCLFLWFVKHVYYNKYSMVLFIWISNNIAICLCITINWTMCVIDFKRTKKECRWSFFYMNKCVTRNFTKPHWLNIFIRYIIIKIYFMVIGFFYTVPARCKMLSFSTKITNNQQSKCKKPVSPILPIPQINILRTPQTLWQIKPPQLVLLFFQIQQFLSRAASRRNRFFFFW